MTSRRVNACSSRDANGVGEDFRISEIPFIAEIQRLTRQPAAIQLRIGLARQLRARCGAQSQFVAYPPDLCGGDDSMDLLQGLRAGGGAHG
jgi:hypothetical protein